MTRTPYVLLSASMADAHAYGVLVIQLIVMQSPALVAIEIKVSASIQYTCSGLACCWQNTDLLVTISSVCKSVCFVTWVLQVPTGGDASDGRVFLQMISSTCVNQQSCLQERLSTHRRCHSQAVQQQQCSTAVREFWGHTVTAACHVHSHLHHWRGG